MLENPLDPNITCLPHPSTAIRHILKLDVRMLGSHPGLKLLGIMNQLAVNFPYIKLYLWQAQFLLHSSEIRE
jgi:hypothetical protein